MAQIGHRIYNHDDMGRAKIITVANLKGGVGKTTTSYALAAAIHNRGRVGVVLDLDPGGGTYRSLAGNPQSGQATIGDVLYGKVSLADALVRSPMQTPGRGMIWTVPFDGNLASVGGPGQNILRNAIEPVLGEENGIDYVILDTHPSESDLRGPMEVADHIVIPCKLSNNDLNVSAQTVLLARSLARGLAPLSGLLVGDLKRPINNEIRIALDGLRGMKLTLRVETESGREDVVMYYGKSWLSALNGNGRNLENAEDLILAEKVLTAVETYHAPDTSWGMFMSLLKGMPNIGGRSNG